MRITAFGWQEWFVKRSGSVELEASIARRSLTSTIMMRCCPRARCCAARTLTDSPDLSELAPCRNRLGREGALPVDAAGLHVDWNFCGSLRWPLMRSGVPTRSVTDRGTVSTRGMVNTLSRFARWHPRMQRRRMPAIRFRVDRL